MWPRILIKCRGIILGVMIGLSLAASFVILWTNEGRYMKEMPIVSNHAVETSLMKSPVANKGDGAGTAREENEEMISNDEQDPQTGLHEVYGHVKTILFFIGYPRSRHSLLGALLDAHPHMVVSDESMAFRRWRGNAKQWSSVSIYAFFDSLFDASQRAMMTGRRSRVFDGSVANKTSEYSYFVPKQWQGNYDRYIEVIGDKSGAFTARAMLQDDAVDAVHLLEKRSGAKVKFIHVVRNPFDNLATMTLEESNIRKRKGEHHEKINAPETLDNEITRYFHWAAGCNKAREALPSSVIDIPSMEIVKHPADTLRRICAFLEITCSEDYIQDCATTVDPVPSITRDYVEWTEEQKERVFEQMKQFSFFDGYSYDQ